MSLLTSTTEGLRSEDGATGCFTSSYTSIDEDGEGEDMEAVSQW